jgi:hypothetical protein
LKTGSLGFTTTIFPSAALGKTGGAIVSVMHFPLLLEALYNKIEENVH